jgi:hypothetical protein
MTTETKSNYPVETWKRSHTAVLVPIEDLEPGTVIHPAQLVPTNDFNCGVVWDLAYLGLSLRGIAGKLGVMKETVNNHFSKTIAKARAERASELIIKMQDLAEGIGSMNKGQSRAIELLLARLDPEDKEPTVVIQQSFGSNPNLIQSFTLDDLNHV